MNIRAQSRRLSDVPGALLGRQADRVINVASGKSRPRRRAAPGGTPTGPVRDMNEAELWEAIEAEILDSETEEAGLDVAFASEEIASVIGLRMDARGRGRVGVGIRGATVYFWQRGA